MAELYGALSLGVRDYLAKCNFKSAVLGLSGGIDSAVVAAIAVDSLGAENVVGVSMPSPYSSRGSIDDALALARNLGIRCLRDPDRRRLCRLQSAIQEGLRGLPEDTTEENMQSRLRGMILMALSNKFGHLSSPPATRASSRSATARFTATWPAASPSSATYRKRSSTSSRAGSIEKREIIPRLDHRETAQCGAETRPGRPGFASALRHPRSNSAALRRGKSERTRHHRARLRGKNRALDSAPGRPQRIQARPGRAGIKVTSRAFGVGRRMPIAQQYRDWDPLPSKCPSRRVKCTAQESNLKPSD